MQTPFSILRQRGREGQEERIVAQYAMVTDTPMLSVGIDGLHAHEDALQSGRWLPVGSVEFVRQAMAYARVREPSNLSYPACLAPYLHRRLEQREAGRVVGHWFIKPTTTKSFTGFVVDTSQNSVPLDDHDRLQHIAFLMLQSSEMVWVSDPVTWLSEVRYYIVGAEIRGYGRYDSGPDDALEPDISVVREMAARMASEGDAPSAFTLDVGVLEGGVTALVECNDAWAIGYYRGTLSYKDYVALLWARWQQLFDKYRITVP